MIRKLRWPTGQGRYGRLTLWYRLLGLVAEMASVPGWRKPEHASLGEPLDASPGRALQHEPVGWRNGFCEGQGAASHSNQRGEVLLVVIGAGETAQGLTRGQPEALANSVVWPRLQRDVALRQGGARAIVLGQVQFWGQV